MRFGILGPLEVVDDLGRALSLSPTLGRLLAVLLVNVGEDVYAADLIDALWPKGGLRNPQNTLQQHVRRLRQQIGEDRISTRPNGYRLELRLDDRLDSQIFEQALRRARDLQTGSDLQRIATAYKEAQDAWRGKALAAFMFDDFAIRAADRLSDLKRACLEERYEVERRLGREGALVPELQQSALEFPLSETIHQVLMRALYATGRAGDALGVFDRFVEHLRAENREPGPLLDGTRRAIVQNMPGLPQVPEARRRVGIPASHRSWSVELPSPPARVVRSETPVLRDRTRLRDALLLWLDEVDSNFAAVSGEFGIGKTTHLRELVSDAMNSGRNAVYVQFDQPAHQGQALPTLMPQIIAEAGDVPEIVAVDNFDSVNSLVGIQLDPPDLRYLSALIQCGARCVIATRRPVLTLDNELARQLRSNARYETHGIVMPWLISVESLGVEDLRRAAAEQQNVQLKQVADDLDRSDPEYGYLRRPLFVAMLMTIRPEDGDVSDPGSLLTIYREYTAIALSRDFDNQLSRLSEAHKRRILNEIAWDIFIGAEGSEMAWRDGVSVSYERMSERVLETVLSDPMLRASATGASYQWTQDFIGTNHVFREAPSAVPVGHIGRPRCSFVHQSFQEYFLGEAIIGRIFRGESLGIAPKHVTQALFDSLALAFVREEPSGQFQIALRRVATSTQPTWPDRLLYLYLLEDAEDFLELLASAPEEYWAEVAAARDSVEAFFVWKMITYQMVIPGAASAYDYVAALRVNEDAAAVDEERVHQGRGAGTPDFLLRRLANPILEPAIPITVYRLGQMGDSRAVSHLEDLASRGDKQLRALCAEAVDAINARDRKSNKEKEMDS